MEPLAWVLPDIGYFCDDDPDCPDCGQLTICHGGVGWVCEKCSKIVLMVEN